MSFWKWLGLTKQTTPRLPADPEPAAPQIAHANTRHVTLSDDQQTLLDCWLCADRDERRAAEKEIESRGGEMLPLLRVVIGEDRPERFSAMRMVLKMGAPTVADVICPKFSDPDFLPGLLEVIEGLKIAVPELWPDLSRTLASPKRGVLLRGMRAVQAQVTCAKIEELDFAEWLLAVGEPIARLAGSEDSTLSKRAAELAGSFPVVRDGLFPILAGSLARSLAKREAENSYILRALMVQEVSDSEKAKVLQQVLQWDTVYSYDRTVAAGLVSQLGDSQQALIQEIETCADRLSTSDGADKKTAVELQKIAAKLRESTEEKSGNTLNLLDSPVLDRWVRDLDAEHTTSSSRHDRSAIARGQIDRCRDEGLVQPLLVALHRKQPARVYDRLVMILGKLVSNTGNAELRQWVVDECSKENLKPFQIEALFLLHLQEVKPLARKAMFLKNGKYSSSCFNLLKVEPTEEDVDLLCECGRRDPSLRLLVIFALEETKSSRAVPYLMDLVRREYESKKSEEREWRAYALSALGKLGDESIVPELCDLMKKRGGSLMLFTCLSDLGDPRALEPSLSALTALLDKGYAAEHWSEGHRTPVYSVCLMAKKVSRLNEPEVLALVSRLREPTQWGRLLPEEKAFIEETWPQGV